MVMDYQGLSVYWGSGVEYQQVLNKVLILKDVFGHCSGFKETWEDLEREMRSDFPLNLYRFLNEVVYAYLLTDEGDLLKYDVEFNVVAPNNSKDVDLLVTDKKLGGQTLYEIRSIGPRSVFELFYNIARRYDYEVSYPNEFSVRQDKKYFEQLRKELYDSLETSSERFTLGVIGHGGDVHDCVFQSLDQPGLSVWGNSNSTPPRNEDYFINKYCGIINNPRLLAKFEGFNDQMRKILVINNNFTFSDDPIFSKSPFYHQKFRKKIAVPHMLDEIRVGSLSYYPSFAISEQRSFGS